MSAEIKTLKPEPIWRYFYDLTQIPRPTGHVEEAIQYMLDFGQSLGLETKRDETGNVVIFKPATPGYENCPIVTLQSHLDMVPQKNSKIEHDFYTDPIDAYIDGEWVKARDTTLGADNGIGVAMAMAVLADTSLKHGPIEGLFTIDEEVGMVGAFGLKPGFLKGDIMINLDSEDEGILFVGCAGGADVNVTFQYQAEELAAEEEEEAIKLTLTGLKGGHSGIDIILGRANANKLMFRLLKEAIRNHGARLASIDGGSLRNAIPREAVAVISVPKAEVTAIKELTSTYEAIYKKEYASLEPGLQLTAEETTMPTSLIPEEIQDALVNAIEGCQNGVISMLADFPDTVESSSNLALVKSDDGVIEVKFLVRSSSESRKLSVASALESIFSMAGGKVEYGGAYGGWQPNIHSLILKTMEQSYEKLYGKKPDALVIHAGLECGIIQESYPNMDMISIGPDITHPHSPDEAVHIGTVSKVWEFLIATLEGMKG